MRSMSVASSPRPMMFDRGVSGVHTIVVCAGHGFMRGRSPEGLALHDHESGRSPERLALDHEKRMTTHDRAIATPHPPAGFAWRATQSGPALVCTALEPSAAH